MAFGLVILQEKAIILQYILASPQNISIYLSVSLHSRITNEGLHNEAYAKSNRISNINKVSLSLYQYNVSN